MIQYTQNFPRISYFAFNKKHFHTNSATSISCILWINQGSNNNSISLDAYDIKNYLKVDSNIPREIQDLILEKCGKKLLDSISEKITDKFKILDILIDIAGKI